MTEELTATHLRELGNLIAGVSAEERERMYVKAADYVRRHSAYVVPADVEKVVNMFREVYPNRPVPNLASSGGGRLSKQPTSPYVSYVIPAVAVASTVALLVFLTYSIAKRRSRPAERRSRPAKEPSIPRDFHKNQNDQKNKAESVIAAFKAARDPAGNMESILNIIKTRVAEYEDSRMKLKTSLSKLENLASEDTTYHRANNRIFVKHGEPPMLCNFLRESSERVNVFNDVLLNIILQLDIATNSFTDISTKLISLREDRFNASHILMQLDPSDLGQTSADMVKNARSALNSISEYIDARGILFRHVGEKFGQYCAADWVGAVVLFDRLKKTYDEAWAAASRHASIRDDSLQYIFEVCDKSGNLATQLGRRVAYYNRVTKRFAVLVADLETNVKESMLVPDEFIRQHIEGIDKKSDADKSTAYEDMCTELGINTNRQKTHAKSIGPIIAAMAAITASSSKICDEAPKLAKIDRKAAKTILQSLNPVTLLSDNANVVEGTKRLIGLMNEYISVNNRILSAIPDDLKGDSKQFIERNTLEIGDLVLGLTGSLERYEDEQVRTLPVIVKTYNEV